MKSDLSMRVLLTIAVLSCVVAVIAFTLSSRNGAAVFEVVADVALGVTAVAVLASALILVWSGR
jgi:hypothetical protein